MFLDPFNVLQPEFCGNDFDISDRVDVAFYVDDFGVIEGAHHLEDTIDGSDVGQEGVSKTSTCGGALKRNEDREKV